MKEYYKNLIVLCVALFLIFSGFFANFKVNNVVFAENTQIVKLLDENFSENNASSFTPFNFESEERMAGYSLKPSLLSNNTFSENIELNYSEILYESDNNTFGAWIYFSNKNLHNLKFSLIGQNSLGDEVSLIFVLNAETLALKLEKSEDNTYIDLTDDGYGWNYIEIPFSFASNYGAVNDGVYYNFNNLKIEYNSSSVDENVEYAEIYFYEISIYNSNLETLTVKEENKQPFRFCKFNFYSPNELNQVYAGDILSLPSRTASLAYAWIGDIDVKQNANSYIFAVKVIANNEENLWEFGTTYEFSETGNTIIKFEINDNGNEVLWQALNFYVMEFVGISFNQSITQFSVGKTVRIYLNTNLNLTEISSLCFDIEGDCATIINVNEDSKYVDVKMNDVGTFILKATANGKRLFDDNINLSCEREFSVVGKTVNDNRKMIIVLSVLLGCAAVVGVVWGIKAIISTNKYKVR